MLYECSCGFTAPSAHQFYKHLAASKESISGHQLKQARFADKVEKSSRHDLNLNFSQHAEGFVSAGQTTVPMGPTASWVDEYLMVDQGDAAAHYSSAPPQFPDQPSAPAMDIPVPVSTGPSTLNPFSQHHATPSPELDSVPLREMPGVARGWSLTRQRSSTVVPRPPPAPPTLQNSASVKAGAACASGSKPFGLDADEVELVERAEPDPGVPSTSQGGVPSTSQGGVPSTSQGGGAGPSQGGVPSTSQGGGAGPSSTRAAQAALRMSGTVVNAMVVGLSPWRWFGPSAGGGGGGAGGGPDGGAPESGAAGGLYGSAGGTRRDVVEHDTAGDGVEGLRMNVAQASFGATGDDGVLAGPPWGPDSPGTLASLEPVRTVRDVLLWRHPWHTGRIFGAGLYLAVCGRQLAKGHDLLQPSTALFALCFLVLLRNVVRVAVANYRRAQQLAAQGQGQGAQGQGEDGGTPRDVGFPSPSPSQRDEEEAERLKEATQLQQRVETALRGFALGAARYGAALVVLGLWLLSGRRAITSALVAALLWLGMVVGELRIMSQPMFWLLCYLALFTIPAAYYRCRRAMDAGVESALRFVVRVLVSGSRTALLMAGGVAAVLLAVLPLNFILRASLAAAAAFGVLLWQSEAAAMAAAAAGRGTGGLMGQWALVGGGGGEGGRGGRLLGGGGAMTHQHSE